MLKNRERDVPWKDFKAVDEVKFVSILSIAVVVK